MFRWCCFNDVLEHALRIDRVFRQPQGHLILIGTSGSGKTTLSRFVAWMNGLSIFQIKVHGRYSAEDFDDDLRTVLRACGCKGQKVCFIMDESNVSRFWLPRAHETRFSPTEKCPVFSKVTSIQHL